MAVQGNIHIVAGSDSDPNTDSLLFRSGMLRFAQQEGKRRGGRTWWVLVAGEGPVEHRITPPLAQPFAAGKGRPREGRRGVNLLLRPEGTRCAVRVADCVSACCVITSFGPIEANFKLFFYFSFDE